MAEPTDLPGSTVLLTIPAKAKYLVFGRLVLTGLSRTAEIDPETLADLKLAVTEACSNSIRHAYEHGGDVSIRYELGGDRLAIEVVDDGRGFEPDADAPGPLELDAGAPGPLELDEDGMGLAIIRALVNELELGVGAEGRGSRVRLTKLLR